MRLGKLGYCSRLEDIKPRILARRRHSRGRCRDTLSASFVVH